MVDKIVKNEILPDIYRRGYLHLYIDSENKQDNLPKVPTDEDLDASFANL